MSSRYAENKEYAEDSQRGRYQYLRRAVWNPPTEVARKGWTDSRGTCRNNRNTESNAVPVGMWGSLPNQRTSIPCYGCSKNQAFPSFGRPEKIISDKIYQTVDTPIDTILPFGRISHVNLFGGYRITKRPASFCPERLTPPKQNGRVFCINKISGNAEAA